ncbi:MAG: hypothetical protein MAG431_02537 [Chloroflexi bacterium]|nr:hypothetical protein [Chloroflexota bacterium]
MDDFLSLRIVIDTNIVFEGLTKKGSAAGLIVDAWLAGLLDVYVSNALAYEYMDVLSRKLSEKRWQKIVLVLGGLLAKTEFIDIYFSWRPSSPDPGDEHVIDCAMNAGAVVLTSNVRDFRLAKESLGLQVMNPVEFLNYLALELE